MDIPKSMQELEFKNMLVNKFGKITSCTMSTCIRKLMKKKDFGKYGRRAINGHSELENNKAERRGDEQNTQSNCQHS
ncbi:hypothetical protein Glove_365g83 [Diversispora epigaea]|uniref:Uncharacterized protein n=1 Tax=Diversispora epigaea TaxID=1348612 RepID=A0A397HFJ6_9GLOM|nr:hypothetical protein Glove_365g83 [Diversispora epigaea]